MEAYMYFTFVVATTIMIALPGPSVLLTVAHSISFGWKHGIFTVAGATIGIAVQLIVAAIGLVSLLNMVVAAFDWLRWAGAAYLVYLGLRQWRSVNIPLEFTTSSVSLKHVFVQGLITTILNPKSLIFITAFLPQFIDVTRPLAIQFAFAVLTFLAIAFMVTSAWALVAAKLREFLQSHRALQAVARASGGLMIIAGVGLALARRSS